ncbi:MAG: recombinase family protein [Anaerolineae bacterium]|jgi:DNA invertase Pin-like site-specific DNA recombinase|nr:recombinase family protein [Anaerolineae bacterium]
MKQDKILKSHLNRQAVVYIRQSAPHQVRDNLESQKRQYQLVHRAHTLGWASDRCVVIDDDQGRSGSQSYNRPGYQRLTALIALQEVGIVFGLEVSRLARNSLDWYQLLELAAAFDVLIADEDGVYDPAEFNDRLLLGLKGTISEVELYQIRSRLLRGRLNKAQRGELRLNLPVGLERDPVIDQPRLPADQSVRRAVASVFTLFRQHRSLRGVLNFLRRNQLQLPYLQDRRADQRQIEWRQPSYDAIWAFITNPVYAGVYCYGKTQTFFDPVHKTSHVRHRPQAEWDVFIPEHHPGYITLAEFDENQAILANNRSVGQQSQGAPREGAALLQGLVWCQHCGAKMGVRYSHGQAYYICDLAHARYGDPICNRANAKRLDSLVVEQFLAVVNQESLALARSFDQDLSAQRQLAQQQEQDKVQRLSYEADLARRRYEAVDPANRLVAQTLETEWNQRLNALQAGQKTYQAQKLAAPPLHSTLADMEKVVTHLKDYWQTQQIAMQEKKELLRCLLERVFIKKEAKLIYSQLQWYGGAISQVSFPKYLASDPGLYQLILKLAQTQTNEEIAQHLNQSGLKTFTNKSWTSSSVSTFCTYHHIPSRFSTNPALRLPAADYLTSAEAATQLGVSQAAIQKWWRQGILAGKQSVADSRLWIQWSSQVKSFLDGTAALDPHMVSVRSLCQERNQSPEAIFAWARLNQYSIFRLQRGSRYAFYILPHSPSRQSN